ncbi:heterokaryon incompatibility protein-domain-containing protein [Halenospora varia]|nr:heterokaryon incompatibility protein-domain-containing protein [Halenospora varia]
MSNPNFVYEPLNGEMNEIRLLYIDTNSISNGLECRLARFSLDDDRPYVALSYAWNDTTLTCEGDVPDVIFIQLNGQRFEVGHNLATALNYFYKHLPKWLWIDAICINQNDIDERSEQVLRMGSIYAKAQSVLVWLGREHHNSNRAVKLIETVATFDDTVHASDWILSSLKDQTQISAWVSVHHLFERSWWTRVWIRQEAALAQSVEMVVGDRKLSWDSLEKFIVNLSAVFHVFGQQFLHQQRLEINHKALNALMTLQNLRKARLSGDTMQYGILQNLIMTLHSKCSDDRDRIYGIIGLSSDATVEKADYRLSAKDIFIDFTKSYIQASNQLDIMLIDTQPRHSMQLPTWAPDWGSEGSGRIALSNTWSHAAPYRTSITFSQKNNVLTCQGVYIDEVDGCGYDFGSPRTDPFGMVVHPSSRSNAYKTEVEGFQALWTSIIANKARYAGGESQAPREAGAIFVERCRVVDRLLGSIITDQSLQPFRDGSTEFEKWFQRNWNFTFAGRTLRSWALDTEWEFNIKRSQGEDARAAIDMFEATCMHVSRNRRLITTLEGYVGHAPREVKRGDAIYVLPGCKVPVVLRNIGGQYHLLGECYVHGIMNEEAFYMGKDITNIDIA